MSAILSQMRVQTYVTLLSAMSLATSLSQPTTRIAPRVRAAWTALTVAEQQRVMHMIHASPTKMALGKAQMHLVEDPEVPKC